jgi:hypothetical protein
LELAFFNEAATLEDEMKAFNKPAVGVITNGAVLWSENSAIVSVTKPSLSMMRPSH